jgi:hypothetical protein
VLFLVADHASEAADVAVQREIDAGLLLRVDDPWLIEILTGASGAKSRSGGGRPTGTSRSSTTPWMASPPSGSACTSATG